nr:MAG TPA: hypothetical protein [Caudoviricetes sp.]
MLVGGTHVSLAGLDSHLLVIVRPPAFNKLKR